MSDLRTDYTNDILAEEMNGKRRFKLVKADGSTEIVSIEDVTEYEQLGSLFGAGDLNKTNQAVNQISLRPVNNNILINSNFSNPVNQREYDGSVTSESMYTIDRWKVNAAQSFDIGEEGITFKPSSKNGFFVQRIESKGLVGKTVTFSMRINGKTHSFTHVLSKKDVSGEMSIDNTLRMFVSYDSASDCFGVSLEIKAGATPTIEWAKLELGEIATPYVPRLYGEELLLCKRFYQKISARESKLYYVTNDALRFFLNHDIEMRVPPTTDFNNIEVTANLTLKTGFANSNESITTRYTTLVFTKKSHGLGYSDGLSLNGTVILDAEL